MNGLSVRFRSVGLQTPLTAAERAETDSPILLGSLSVVMALTCDEKTNSAI